MLKLIILIFMMAPVYAETLETILTKTLSPLTNECTPETSAKMCAQELCGPPGLSKSLLLTNENILQGLETSFENSDKSLLEVEKKMKAHLQELTQNLNKLKTHLDSGNQLIDFQKWDHFDLFQAEYEVFNKYISPSVDFSKPVKDRLTMRILDRTKRSAEENKIINKYADRMKMDILQNPKLLIKNGVLTKAEALDQIKKLWSEISKFDLAPNTREQLKLKIQKPDLDRLPTLYEEFEKYLQRLKGITKASEPKLFCNDLECKQMMKNYFQKLYPSSLKNLKDELHITKYSDEILRERAKTCLANNILKNDMNQKAETFEKIIPSVIESFISKGMANYSSHSKDVFREFVKTKVNFNLKYQKKYEFSSLLSRLQVGDNANSVLSDAKEWLKDPFSLMEECYLPYSKSDQVVPDSDNLVLELSYFTCSNLDPGKTILAHELGHVLSYAVSQGLLSPESRLQFLKNRDCISSRHIKAQPSLDKNYGHGNDTLYSEEDHADFIAETTYADGKLFSCGFLNKIPRSTSYEVNLQESQESHSNPFLRLIWEAIERKRKLPKSCEAIFNEHTEYDLKSCN